MSDAVLGGTWAATNGNALVSGSGAVHGFSAGVDTIKYTVTNSCGSSVATVIVTVEPLPSAGILTGATTVCVNDTIMLSDGVVGGTWSDADGNVFISAGGIVLGVTAGTDVITYTVTNSCSTATATHTIVIDPLPVAGSISGADTVCIGETINLTDAATGGAWSASNTNVLVSGAGGVHGLTSGTVNIIYTVTNNCGSDTALFLVNVKDCNTGVANITGPSPDISIFPNPAHTEIMITSANLINQLVITDLLGRIVYSRQQNSLGATIDVSVFIPGVYFVKVNNVDVRKFVKE